jgi:hemoglobin/transferrin/lactoferrin receptor protein
MQQQVLLLMSIPVVKMKKVFSVMLFSVLFSLAAAQEATGDSTAKELNEIVISGSKFAEKKRNIAQRIDVISAKFIAKANTQNTGDLLMNTGNVFVQKSQQGGSSPVIRGFEASRVLLVVDGVRMNNLIYRSGHLQNAITIDQNMLESMEVLYGPASTLYGSDALGGVVHFRTKAPKLSTVNKTFLVSGNSFVRYSSANNEKSAHVSLNPGWKKFAWLQSYTFSDFGDMKMGSNYPGKYPTFGRRDSFITRINNIDTVLKNTDSRVQKFSGYRQWDILQKLLFRQSEKISHAINFQYSNTTNVPRYDRLQDKRNFGGTAGNTLRWAEWYYGPQKRLLSTYELSIAKTRWFDHINLNVNYQAIEESRVQREYRHYDRQDKRVEKVDVAGFILDTRKTWNNHELTMGADGQMNLLQSTASRTNINTSAVSTLDTRYPDGKNRMNNFGLFAQHIYKFKGKKLVLNDGIRLQNTTLYSSIADNSFFNLPFNEIKQNNTAFTGNIGLVYLPAAKTKLSVNISSGFRVPNVDDLAKIFESGTSGSIRQVVVPNPGIKPERTYNIDLGINQNIGKNFRTELSGFYTLFRNALVKAPFLLNGQDSVIYNGVKSQVLANVNANKAYLYGFSAAVYAGIRHFTFSSTITYTEGRFQTDASKNSTVYEKQPDGSYRQVSKKVSSKPLDHIPPLFGKTSIAYEKNKLLFEVFALYNGWKKLDDFNADGEDNAQYATADGMPGWFTLNFRSSFSIQKNLSVQFSAENVFDRNYRYFASGFSAPGRNFIAAVRAGF